MSTRKGDVARALLREPSARTHESARGLCKERKKIAMKKVSQKLLWSVIAVALLAPLSAAALIVGARVAELTQSDGNDLLLVALAFGGAAVSALNGLGRRMAGINGTPQRQPKVSRRARSVVHLNY
jgi:hypothetical protein